MGDILVRNKLFLLVILFVLFLPCSVSAMGVGGITIDTGIENDDDTGQSDIMIQDDDAESTDSISILEDTLDDDIKIESVDESNIDSDIIIEDIDTSIPCSRSYVPSSMYTAIQKVWHLIDNYVDPSYYLKNDQSGMTKAQISELNAVAMNITKYAKTDYERTKAVYDYVAGRLYYDHVYLAHRYTSDTACEPYDVYKSKKCVCLGYASLSAYLIRSVNIPCMLVYGDDHVYNASYCRELNDWVVFDATWGSGNKYVDGVWEAGNSIDTYFDISLDELAEYTNHEVYYIDGLIDHNRNGMGYYSLVTGFSFDKNDQKNRTWDNTRYWYLELTGAKNKNVYVPNLIDGFHVRNIREFTFNGSDITYLDLSRSNIESIESGALSGAKKLTGVKFNKSLKKIGPYAFSDCVSLKSVNLSMSNIHIINRETFCDCYSLKSVVFPSGLTKIDAYAFYNDKLLLSLDLSQTRLSFIGLGAFEKCRNLGFVTFPRYLAKIGKNCFSDCKKLGSVSFRITKLGVIPNSAFYGCKKLKSVCGSQYLTRIKASAFGDCTSLNSMVLYKRHVKIAKSAWSKKKKVKVKYM